MASVYTDMDNVCTISNEHFHSSVKCCRLRMPVSWQAFAFFICEEQPTVYFVYCLLQTPVIHPCTLYSFLPDTIHSNFFSMSLQTLAFLYEHQIYFSCPLYTVQCKLKSVKGQQTLEPCVCPQNTRVFFTITHENLTFVSVDAGDWCIDGVLTPKTPTL